jgi:hypothetical protein
VPGRVRPAGVASTPCTNGRVIPIPFPASRLRFAGPEELPKIVQHRAHAVETLRGRYVDLSHDTLDALRSWREAQDEQRRSWNELYEDRGLVCRRENGDSHDARAISKRFSAQVTAAAPRPSASTTSGIHPPSSGSGNSPRGRTR